MQVSHASLCIPLAAHLFWRIWNFVYRHTNTRTRKHAHTSASHPISSAMFRQCKVLEGKAAEREVCRAVINSLSFPPQQHVAMENNFGALHFWVEKGYRMASNRSGSTMGCSSEATFSEQEEMYDSRVCKLQFIVSRDNFFPSPFSASCAVL